MKIKTPLYIKYLAVFICTILLLLSCSKDDQSGSNPDPLGQIKLTLMSSATEIIEGDEVTFNIMSDGKDIQADIYIDEKKINGTKQLFEESGEYQVIARKKGFIDSDKVLINVIENNSKTVEIVFNKIVSAPCIPAYGSSSGRMTMSKTHVYTFGMTNQTFKRYSLVDDNWEDLNHTSQLEFAGISGLMQYIEQGILGDGTLLYLNEDMNAYFPQEHAGGIQFRNKWKAVNVPNQYGSGERSTAVEGKYIYYVGHGRKKDYARNIDRYTPDTNTWETMIQLPIALNYAVNTTIYEHKMYIFGHISNPDKSYNTFYLFDTKNITVKKIPLIEDLISDNVPSNRNHQLVALKNHLLLSSGKDLVFVFDIESNQWLKKPINIEGLFDESRNANFMSPTKDKAYAAGTKDGNFVLYDLELIITNE